MKNIIHFINNIPYEGKKEIFYFKYINISNLNK